MKMKLHPFLIWNYMEVFNWSHALAVTPRESPVPRKQPKKTRSMVALKRWIYAVWMMHIPHAFNPKSSFTGCSNRECLQ
jgi:hypothetical protein